MRKIYKKAEMKKGQAMLIAVLFFLTGSMLIVSGIASPVLQDIKMTQDLKESKQSFFTSESGVEDVVYRLKNSIGFSSTEVISIGDSSAITTTAVLSDRREVISVADKNNLIRKAKVVVIQGSGATFNYGMQAGEGGIILENSSSVSGNLYSNGSIVGSVLNVIKGDVVSAGPSGLIDGIHATSSGYANTIVNAIIDGNAYFQSILNTDVDGIEFSNSEDQATSTLPISDDLLDEWEGDAEAGGTISSPCPYIINSDEIIGPVKIECDLIIKGSPTVTIMGAIWVEGNIEIENTATVQVSSSLGSASVVIIADNPLNRLTSSKVEIQNSATFIGSGTEGSYVLVISRNDSAENGGGEKAIEVENTANGDLLIYAGHGEVVLKNNISLREVTAYRIRLQNNAEVIYETGLASLLFQSGPSGGFTIDSWDEIE